MSGDDEGARTAAEAEAIAGAQVGFRGSYGGESGRAAQNYAILQQQEQQRQQQEEQRQQQQQTQRQQAQQQGVQEVQLEPDYASQARERVRSRPGFTDPTTLGDFGTQQRALELSKNGMDYEAALGVALEEQRTNALSTPGTRDEQFYANELSKLKQNDVELSSSFHVLTRDAGATNVKENPYEVRGDLAVEFLKGSPDKRSEVFSPLSGQMKQYLPGEGRGLQETMWDTARDRKTPAGSYMRAIEVINNSSGGFATGKVGRPNSPGPGSSNGGAGGGGGSPGDGGLPAPFKSTVLGVRETTSRQSGALPFLGVVPVLSPFLSNFMPQQTKREVDVLVTGEIKDYESNKPAYTRAFVDAAGRKTDTLETDTTITTLPKTGQGVQTFTTITEGKTPFNESVENRLPANTLKALEYNEEILGGMAERNPTFAPMAMGASEVKSMVKEPGTVAVSYGSGLVFGGVVRGAGAVLPRVAKYSPTAARVLGIGGKAAGYGLAGLYAYDVTSRSTQGFTNYSPVRVAQRATPIMTMEVLPLTGGFIHGGRSPEIVRGGYEYARAGAEGMPARVKGFTDAASVKIQTARKNIPTVDQIKYKWVEIREPGSAMSSPAASERFGFSERARGITNSNKWVEANRIAMRSSGTRPASERGTVSGRPTPRQESLRLNYNPTAPLKEINTNIASASRAKNILSGIRGTLRGKWDAASSAVDEFAHLPLKERWKARTAAREQPGSKGYFGSGKPSGGLQSGVGEFGTTVRSGRQSLELRSASSGVSADVQSLAPQRLELTPSRRTAQRSRAFDMDFEYEGRRLPQGMQRPQPAGQGQATLPQEIQAQNQNMRLSPVFDVVPQQWSSSVLAQRQEVKAAPFTTTRFEIKEETRNDQKRESSIINMQTPITRNVLGVSTASISALISSQGQRQVQKQESVFTQLTTPTSSRITRTRPERTTTRTPFTDTIITPEKPKLPPGMWLPDSGGSSGSRPFSRQSFEGWSNQNLVGADLLGGGGPFSSGGSGNAKCRHKSMKAKLNCSRFWRNG